MSDSATLWTVAYQAPLSWNSPARILEWVAMPSSRGSSWPRDWTQVSRLVGRFFTVWATKNEAMHFLCIASYISPLCLRQQEDSNSKCLGLVFHPRKHWELREDRDKTGSWMFFWILALIFSLGLVQDGARGYKVLCKQLCPLLCPFP